MKKFVCWDKSEVPKIIDTRALDIEKAFLLATHSPFERLKLTKSDNSVLQLHERELFSSLIDYSKDKDVFAVINGYHGTGKSNLIWWLAYQISKTDQNIKVVLIKRTDASLSRTLKSLVRDLGVEFQDLIVPFSNALTSLTQEGLGIRFLDLVSERINPKALIDSELPPELKTLKPWQFLKEDYVVEHMMRSDGVANRIVRKLTSKDESVAEIVKFKESDLILPDKSKIKRMSTASKSLAVRFLDHNEEKLKTEFLKILNNNIEIVISNIIDLSPDRIKNTFDEIRVRLKKKNLKLALLIEDVATFQGVDRALIDYVSDPSTDEDKSSLISAIGITDEYYSDLKGNILDRISHHIQLEKGSDKGLFYDQEQLNKFTSKYLNAIRMGESQLKDWYSHIENGENLLLPNKCTNCEFRVECHKTFDSINDFGLYPFNSNAIRKLFENLKSQEKTPRRYLLDILQPVLSLAPEQIENGSFPKEPITPFVDSPSFITATSNIDSFLNRTIPGDQINKKNQYENILKYYGNGNCDVSSENDMLYIGDVPQNLFEAFDLKLEITQSINKENNLTISAFPKDLSFGFTIINIKTNKSETKILPSSTVLKEGEKYKLSFPIKIGKNDFHSISLNNTYIEKNEVIIEYSNQDYNLIVNYGDIKKDVCNVLINSNVRGLSLKVNSNLIHLNDLESFNSTFHKNYTLPISTQKEIGNFEFKYWELNGDEKLYQSEAEVLLKQDCKIKAIYEIKQDSDYQKKIKNLNYWFHGKEKLDFVESYRKTLLNLFNNFINWEEYGFSEFEVKRFLTEASIVIEDQSLRAKMDEKIFVINRNKSTLYVLEGILRYEYLGKNGWHYDLYLSDQLNFTNFLFQNYKGVVEYLNNAYNSNMIYRETLIQTLESTLIFSSHLLGAFSIKDNPEQIFQQIKNFSISEAKDLAKIMDKDYQSIQENIFSWFQTIHNYYFELIGKIKGARTFYDPTKFIQSIQDYKNSNLSIIYDQNYEGLRAYEIFWISIVEHSKKLANLNSIIDNRIILITDTIQEIKDIVGNNEPESFSESIERLYNIIRDLGWVSDHITGSYQDAVGKKITKKHLNFIESYEKQINNLTTLPEKIEFLVFHFRENANELEIMRSFVLASRQMYERAKEKFEKSGTDIDYGPRMAVLMEELENKKISLKRICELCIEVLSE